TALTAACETLARMIIKDGEGATKFIEIRIEGAATEQDAERVASVVATSPLVKTAFFGEDFNPGRIVSAIGRAGAEFDWSQLRVAIGGELVFQNDTFLSVPDATARELMAQPELIVDIALGAGACALRFFTCDLTHDYVRINSEYTT
ncbi:MAG: bifunctional ornithine acetyltransferase/N-acetylglutamate synthase, partial [Bacilli bacterium]